MPKLSAIISLFLLFLALPKLQGQESLFGKGWAYDASYHYGKIIRHSPKIAFEIPDNSQGFIFNARLQTHGKKEWHQWRNFPEVGVAFEFYNLNDREVLGYLAGIIPHLNLHLIRKKRFSTNLQIGSGLTLIDRFYDPLTNPTNTSIGSRLNNITVFRLDFNWDFTPKWGMSLGGSFSHISNAAAASPNLGINIPALSIGVQYKPHVLEQSDYSYHQISKKATERWGLFADMNLGFKENSIPGGAKVPIYQANLSGRFSLNKVNDLQAGFTYEFHRPVYEFALQSYTFTEKDKARAAATRYLFFVADEFRYGRIGIYLYVGIYLNDALAIPFPIANRLGLRYYFPTIGKAPLQGEFYAGVYLKVHRGVAEFAALGGGFRF